MVRIGVLGGRLQGIEATYLCSKAGYESVLIDKDAQAPAMTLADETYVLDILKDVGYAKKILKGVDAVLPASENKEALMNLEKLCRELGIPFMQDNAAFWITSDKLTSMKFLLDLHIPTPIPWPDCEFPVIVKPSTKSGSESIFRANTLRQLQKALEKTQRVDEKVVIQEFVEGLALSLEVVADKRSARPLQITGLEFDETYSCKRVYAPVKISADVESKFDETCKEIARGLGLKGLTDVQAISKDGVSKVNEINARLPSQTPTVVYHSSGINIVGLLAQLFLENELSNVRIRPDHAVIYQHIKIFDGELRVQGEHVMDKAKDLQIIKDFYGAHEAITNMTTENGHIGRVATLIVKAKSLMNAKKKTAKITQRLMDENDLHKYSDPSPSTDGK